MTQKQQLAGAAQTYPGGLMTCEFSQITDPGLYVETHTGSLVRVPEDAVRPNRSPVLSITHTEPWVVTKISNDPFLSITKARMIAADLDLAVNF